MTEPVPTPDPTQLMRYLVQADALMDADSISKARQVLTGLGLVVDRIEDGEAEVVASITNPGSDGIQAALEAAGFSVQHVIAESN